MMRVPFLTRPTIQKVLAQPTAYVGQPLTLTGRIQHRRSQRQRIFAELKEGTSLSVLQCVFERSSLPSDALDQMRLDTAVRVSGHLVPTNRSFPPYELAVDDLVVHPHSAAPHPLLTGAGEAPDGKMTREALHMRLRLQHMAARMRVRGKALRLMRNVLEDELGFCAVQAPLLTINDCEGGGEQFGVAPVDTEPDGGSFFDAADPRLQVSGQLEAEALAMALDRVYVCAPAFRAERSTGSRHLAEFWMLEPEMVDCSLDEAIDVAEKVVKTVLQGLVSDPDLAAAARGDTAWCEQVNRWASQPWPQLTYAEAQEACGKGSEHALTRRDEEMLTERLGPVFVRNWPVAGRPFYARVADDGKTAECFDLYVPRVGELIGGSVREESEERLLATIRERGMDEKALAWYVDLRKFGTVPHAGFGLGVDRLVQWVCNARSIRDVIAAPRHFESKIDF